MLVPLIFSCVILTTVIAQLPPRLQIPGAVFLSSGQAAVPQAVAYRPQFRFQASPENSPVRTRGGSRPPPITHTQIRPVIEESEENDAPAAPTPARASFFLDDEVSRLGLNALQTAVRQADEIQDQRAPETRPIPVLRSDIREREPSVSRPAVRQQHYPESRPVAAPVARPVIRQELKQEQLYQQYDEPAPVQRQPISVRLPQAQPVPVRKQPASRPITKPVTQNLRDEDRTRKPPVKILRKYRTENEDGSITWGYENEDGSFKEELIGTDCITRGKYGYVDPDGVRREYSYETGAKCDEPEEEELEVLPAPGNRQQASHRLQPAQPKKAANHAASQYQ